MDNGQHDMNDSEDDTVALLDLHRLLHAMEHYNPPTESSDSLMARVHLAQSLWEQFSHRITKENVYLDWERRLERACRHAQRIASERQRVQASVTDDDSMISRIFGSGKGHSQTDDNIDEEEEDEFEIEDDDDEDDNYENEESSTFEDRNPLVQKANLQDLQKAQREQVEKAIGEMAAQLKAQTSKIHATLQTQADDLEDMEDIAAEKVTEVSEVATKVQEEVSRSWSQTIGTWTLLFTTIGAFVFALVTIQFAPKRKGACIFFCPPSPPKDEFCRMVDGKMECLNVEDIYNNAKKTVEMINDVDESSEGDLVDIAGQDSYDEMVDEHDDITLPPAEQMRKEALHDLEEYTNDVSKEDSETECEVDMYGNCVDHFGTSEDDSTTGALESSQEPPKTQKVKSNDSFDDLDPFGGVEDSNVHDSAPQVVLCNGKPFGSRDVRRAAVDGDYESLECYLNGRPEFVDSQDKKGWAVIHLAAKSGRADIVGLALDAGADFGLLTTAGKTAGDIAREVWPSHHPIFELLSDATQTMDIPREDSSDQSTETIIQATSNQDNTLTGGSPDALGSVDDATDRDPINEINSDASLDTTNSDPNDKSAHEINRLNERAGEGDENEVCGGADFVMNDVHLAAHNGDISLFACYMNRNPDFLDSQDQNGWGVLHLAARQGHTEILELATDEGANAMLRTVDGRTALEIASTYLPANHEAIDLLRDLQEASEDDE